MEEIIKLFKEIQETKSTIRKKEIIEENKTNQLFCETLIFLLDNSIVTGINKKKLSKKVSVMPHTEINTWSGCMTYLKAHNSGRDTDLAAVIHFIDSQPRIHRPFYEDEVTKRFRLGADAKLVNKAIPGLIKTWDAQLGSSYEKLRLKNRE